jgi:hypothetical protein
MKKYLQKKLVCEITKGGAEDAWFIHFWLYKWHLATFKVSMSSRTTFSGIVPEPIISLYK